LLLKLLLFFQIKTYHTYWHNSDILRIFGISQNPDTRDYIIVLENDGYCKECGEIYTNIRIKWCKSCQINNLKQDFANWTSGNKKIDDFIQEMRLKIKNYYDIIIEWIPYNQFNNIKNIGKKSFFIVYSAIWRDGLLNYNFEEKKYERVLNEKVTLKCINNLQNDIDKFLDEV
jgi:hypothetical protein